MKNLNKKNLITMMKTIHFKEKKGETNDDI